jgi:hypothetical protein
MFVIALGIAAASFCGVPTLRDGTKDRANSPTRLVKFRYGSQRRIQTGRERETPKKMYLK